MTRSTPVVLTCFVLGLAASALAAGGDPAAPDGFFRQAELSPDVELCGKEFHIPTVLGPTGMNGWSFNDALVVREVEPGSPADGIVLPNDIIRAINGKELGDDPLKALGEQIEACEAAGAMRLSVLRGGEKVSLTIPMRKLGALGKDWPFDCAKSRAIHRDACEYLARIQNPDGSFDGTIHVGFALNGLTWLAAEDPKYWEHARRLAYGYRKHFDPEAYGTVNWGWSYMGVFLAEYYLQTGDHTILPLCQQVAQTLARSQQPSGTWGHGPYPGKGYVQGGSLNNAGLVCWMALNLIKETGVPVDEKALAKATHFFSRFAHRGTVPYGDHRPEFGGGNGKNALPGVCHLIRGEQAESEYYARCVTDTYRTRNRGHTGGYMGFIWGNVHGARNPHYPDYRRMLDYWTWLINVSRRWDGGFLLPESVIGSIYTYRGMVLSTGGMAQVFAMPGRVLRIHGAPKGVFAARDLPPTLRKGIELHRRREFDELRKTVKPTSDLARQLLAAAARAEKDIELTAARIDAALADGNPALASQMAHDLDRYTGGNHPLLEGMRWRIRTGTPASVDAARKLYERYRWLTYTLPKAREAFEKLAADPEAGVYQRLARRELATPPDASAWNFYCELLWGIHSPTWTMDERARAGVLRVSGLRGGNWPRVVSTNTLHEAGVLTDRLARDWTALAAPFTGGYPGKKPTWRMLSVAKGEAPPDGWTAVDFDDGEWQSGPGPIARRGEDGMQPKPNSVQHIRIVFQCDRADYKRLELSVRIQGRDAKAVVYLNGTPVLWSMATQGPRMKMSALTAVPLSPKSVSLLRKGRNVLAVRSRCQGADFGLYASAAEGGLSFKPRPKDWAAGAKLDAPDLSVKTPDRPEIKTVLPPLTTGLTMDPPGKPNEEHQDLFEMMSKRTAPIAQRAKYLGHYDPRIRRQAAYSLMGDGAKAMPFILKALGSKDIRVIRAGCDALAGPFGFAARGRKELRAAMTPDIAGQAVPKLLPLLDHDDTYVREGALLALSNCGKAAAKHLPRIVRLAEDDDWWVRAGVGHVLRFIDAPETADHASETIDNFRAEESIYGKNRLREALVEMAARGHAADRIVRALIADLVGDDGYDSSMALDALGRIGPPARPATPIIQERLEQAKAKEKPNDRQIRKIEGILRRINPQPRPPKKPKRKKR